uniref:Uncharacterized protein n=1 Tax=Phage sp. ctGns7 TaxID=2828003 RepID=A0A8S5S9W8_9VIRU|nr:MAG TPA: hypothetical protein [Phage sp. ctGns7]
MQHHIRLMLFHSLLFGLKWYLNLLQPVVTCLGIFLSLNFNKIV